MRREEKALIIDRLSAQLGEATNFYLADTSAMTAAEINKFRGNLFEKGLSVEVVKNTLMKKAMEKHDDKYEEMYDLLAGTTAVLFTETANLPAKVIKDFRGAKGEKPMIKAAYIDSDVYVGDELLGQLSELKSREELIGEIIGLLQSPIKNVVSVLQSGSDTLMGVLETLAKKEEN